MQLGAMASAVIRPGIRVGRAGEGQDTGKIVPRSGPRGSTFSRSLLPFPTPRALMFAQA